MSMNSPARSLSSIEHEAVFNVISNICIHPSAVASTGRSDPDHSASTTLEISLGLLIELHNSGCNIKG